MKMPRIFFLLFISLSSALFSGCSSMPQNTVSSVDLQRFMGKWYVIASIPTIFESGANNAVETYTWNEKEERIDVDFRFRKDSPTGPEKVMPQKGFVSNHETNAEWKIQPFWPFKFSYLIIDLAPDYSDTVIGVPSRSYVWIMARQPKMSDARYNELVSKIGGLGYDVSKLKKVPQIW